MKSFYLLYDTHPNLMPQMSPMNWLFLFILFSSAFLMLVSKLHFFKYE